MSKFFNTMFFRKNIPTIEGTNSKEGHLHIMVAPITADEDKIRINLITKDSKGNSCGSVCTLISSDVAKMLAYQLIQTFDVPLTGEELEQAEKMSEEYHSQFSTVEDYKSYTPLDII
ncbi:hypothetical protein [Desulfopila inferna]|uniref:hypothetical protein n=1 Tax=Desulfopila inferna TaxID=468528 RepID=UPI0019651D44|nr:hypothetical protein [Desulfopila inferna]MBM9606258.1 hypothetical protein [Desulfopila inferna]